MPPWPGDSPPPSHRRPRRSRPGRKLGGGFGAREGADPSHAAWAGGFPPPSPPPPPPQPAGTSAAVASTAHHAACLMTFLSRIPRRGTLTGSATRYDGFDPGL